MANLPFMRTRNGNDSLDDFLSLYHRGKIQDTLIQPEQGTGDQGIIECWAMPERIREVTGMPPLFAPITKA